jgi:hypothetical protein
LARAILLPQAAARLGHSSTRCGGPAVLAQLVVRSLAKGTARRRGPQWLHFVEKGRGMGITTWLAVEACKDGGAGAL